MAFTSTQTFGGPGGSAFQDDLTQVCRLVGINVRSGEYVDMLQAVWQYPNGATVNGQQHGGGGGSPTSIHLQPGERIVRVDLRSGIYVDQITFFTDQGRQYGPYGGNGGEPHTLSNLENVTGFVGRAAQFVDQIGFWIPAKCP